MKKQIPAIVLAITSIVLLIGYIDANNTVKKLRAEMTHRPTETELSVAVQDAESLMPDTAAVEPMDSADLMATINAEPQPDEMEKDSGRRMIQNIAKMMDNPTMSRVMEASQRGTIGALYADLIGYLNLDAEETGYFMDLLMYRQMKQVDLAMKMMSGGLTDEEKEVLNKDVEDASNLVKEKMEEFLNNPDDYEEFEFYEKTIGERMMLSQMDQNLANSGAPLSDETYRELLGMMHDEKENFQFTSDLNDNENMDMSPQRFSRDNLQNFADDIQQLNTIINSKAQSILTAEQYQEFERSLKTTADMQISQLEMAAQMFGGSNAETESE